MASYINFTGLGTSKKQAEVEQAAANKQQTLEIKNETIRKVVDADTWGTQENPINYRLDSLQPRTSIDTPESFMWTAENGGTPDQIAGSRKRIDDSKIGIAREYKTTPDQISDAFVLHRGGQVKAKTEEFLNSNDGQVNIIPVQEKLGRKGRFIADAEVNGRLLSTERNTPQDNVDFHLPYNALGKAKYLAKQNIANEEQNKDALVSTYDLDTIPGQIGNTAASLIAGTGRVVSGALDAVPSLAATVDELGITEDQRTAYKSRKLKLDAQHKIDTELGKVDLTTAEGNDRFNKLEALRKKYELSPLETELTENTEGRIRSIQDSLQHSEDVKNSNFKQISTYIQDASSKLVNRTNQHEAAAENKAQYDRASFSLDQGLASYKAGNKVEAAGHILKSFKVLGGAVYDTMVDHPDVVMETFAESIPQMLGALKTSAVTVSYALQLSEEAKVVYAKEHGKEAEGRDLAYLYAQSFASAMLDKVGAKAVLGKAPKTKLGLVKAKAKDVTKGVVTEGATEATQSVLEQNAGLQDLSKVNQGQAFHEGVLGAGGSGQFSLTSKPLLGVAAATTAVAKAVPAAAKAVASTKKVIEASKSGDYAGLTTQEKFIALSNKNLEDQTPEEVQIHIGELYKTNSELNAEMEEQKAAIPAEGEKGRKKAKKAVAKLQSKLMDNLTAIEQIESIGEEGADPEQVRLTVNKILDADNAKAASPALEALLGSVKDRSLSVEEAKRVVKSKNIDKATKEKIRAYIKTKSLLEVADNVLNGGPGFIGMVQHEKNIRRATAIGNSNEIKRVTQEYKTWVDSHKVKAARFNAINHISESAKRKKSLAYLNQSFKRLGTDSKGNPLKYTYSSKAAWTKLSQSILDESKALVSSFEEVTGTPYVKPVIKKKTKSKPKATKTSEPTADDMLGELDGLTKSEPKAKVTYVPIADQEISPELETEIEFLAAVDPAVVKTLTRAKDIAAIEALTEGNMPTGMTLQEAESLVEAIGEIEIEQNPDLEEAGDVDGSKAHITRTETAKDIESSSYELNQTNHPSLSQSVLAKITPLLDDYIQKNKIEDTVAFFTEVGSFINGSGDKTSVGYKAMQEISKGFTADLKAQYKEETGEDLPKDFPGNTTLTAPYSMHRALFDNIKFNFYTTKDGVTKAWNKYAGTWFKAKPIDSPLALTPDLFNRLYTDLQFKKDFIQEHNLSEPQQLLLDNMIDYVKEFIETAEEAVYNPRTQGIDVGEKLYDRDLLMYFGKEGADEYNDGIYDKNLLANLAIISYNWLGTGAGNTLYNYENDVLSLLKKNEGTHLSRDVYNRYRNLGTVRTSLINDWGEEAYATSGFDTVEGIPGNIEPRLKGSLGGFIYATLANMEMIQPPETV